MIQRITSKFLVNSIKQQRVLANYSFRKMSSATEDTVLVQQKGNAGIIVLNRPKALNSINTEMVRKIYAALKDFENDKKLVILRGAGGKAFCAGGDVKTVVQSPVADGKEFFRCEYRNNELIGNYKKPYIAFIDGITMGGGVGLSVHGKYRIATERTLFAMPETAIGLFPDVGGGYFLPRMRGNLGAYLGLTGYRLKGRDVHKAGIATHFVESSALDELEDELAKCKSIGDIEETLNKFSARFKDSSEFVLQPHLEQIEKAFGGNSVEKILKNLHKDGSEWAMSTLQLLSKMSPTSLKVTLQQLQFGKEMTLRECLQMEFRLAVHCCIDSDFKEGVRALLIDKDQQPKWNPSTVEEVTQAHVNKFFAPLPDKEELVFDQAKL